MKHYRIWVEIEEHDDEADTYTNLDSPGAAIVQYDDIDKAIAFADALTCRGDDLAANGDPAKVGLTSKQALEEIISCFARTDQDAGGDLSAADFLDCVSEVLTSFDH